MHYHKKADSWVGSAKNDCLLDFRIIKLSRNK